jgi:NitT/TauT family transport system permease protein
MDGLLPTCMEGLLMKRIKATLPVMYASVVLLLIWELVVRVAQTPVYVCPAPSSIWTYCTGADNEGGARWFALFEAGQQTLWATMIGFGVAVGLGIAVGVILASSNLMRKGVYPIANLLQMVPVIALAPLLNIWFGYGIVGVAASAAIVSIFPMIANTVDGLRSADPKLRELFDAYGATRFQRWRLLDLPSAAPQIFTGMKISAGLSVIGAVVGELVSGVINHPPIGALIAQGLRNSNLPLVFGAVFTSAMIGFSLFGLVAFSESVFVGRWHGLGAKTIVEGYVERISILRRFLLILVPCGLLGLAVNARPQSVNGAQTQRSVDHRKTPSAIRIQLNWFPEPEFGGFYAAEHLGFFRDEGLDVQLIPGGPGVATPQLAATGRVEFAVVGADQVVTTRAQGAPLVSVYAAYQTSPRGIMVHSNGPFRSLEALWKSESTVAVEAGLPFVKWFRIPMAGNG